MLALLGVVIGFGAWWSLVWAIVFAALAPLFANIYLSVPRAVGVPPSRISSTTRCSCCRAIFVPGHGLTQAIDSVARFADSPTTEEFSRIVNESRIGRDLNVALASTAERMHTDDFNWAAQAIAINRETGGNLAETLQVGGTIRERNQIRRQVRRSAPKDDCRRSSSSSSRSRCSSSCCSSSRTTWRPLFPSPLGWLALGAAVVLMIIGSVWMLFAVRVKF